MMFPSTRLYAQLKRDSNLTNKTSVVCVSIYKILTLDWHPIYSSINNLIWSFYCAFSLTNIVSFSHSLSLFLLTPLPTIRKLTHHTWLTFLSSQPRSVMHMSLSLSLPWVKYWTLEFSPISETFSSLFSL